MLRPEMKNHPLTQAARYGDAMTEETGLATAVNQVGLDLDDVVYIAQQRALRVLAAQRGETLDQTKPTPVALSPSELAIMPLIVSAYMDAIMIGWLGHRLDSGLISK